MSDVPTFPPAPTSLTADAVAAWPTYLAPMVTCRQDAFAMRQTHRQVLACMEDLRNDATRKNSGQQTEILGEAHPCCFPHAGQGAGYPV